MDERMSESMDIKRFVLAGKKRIWKMFAAALICAVLFCVIYLLFTYVFAGSFPYRSSVLYYIDYDQRTAKETQLYYNDFTWNDVLDSDRIAGRASSACGVPKEEIAKAISSPTMSDIRMLWVYVDMADADMAERVQQAVGAALKAFASEAEGFENISEYDHEAVKLLKPENHWKRWAALGAVIGLVAGLLILMYENALDDSVLIESDVKKLIGTTAAAVLYKDGSEDKAAIKSFFAGLLKGEESVALSCFEKEDADALSRVKELLPEGINIDDDAKLMFTLVKWQETSGRKLRKYADEQELKKVRMYVVITDADRKFFRDYYEA